LWNTVYLRNELKYWPTKIPCLQRFVAIRESGATSDPHQFRPYL
jgi:hypothetical protein